GVDAGEEGRPLRRAARTGAAELHGADITLIIDILTGRGEDEAGLLAPSDGDANGTVSAGPVGRDDHVDEIALGELSGIEAGIDQADAIHRLFTGRAAVHEDGHQRVAATEFDLYRLALASRKGGLLLDEGEDRL